ncbi:MAG TPA: hypothetical protein VH796_03615 [Nitrososphaeraceae archaeon]
MISHDEEQQTIGVFSTIDLAKLAIRSRWNVLMKSDNYVKPFDALMSIEELELDNPNYETANMIYFDYGYDQGLIQRKNAKLLNRKRGRQKFVNEMHIINLFLTLRKVIVKNWSILLD